MPLAILQLSDIHFTSSDNPATAFLPLCSTIFNSSAYTGISQVIILICGDIAYHGTENEYDIANEAIGELKGKILESIPTATVHVVVSAGNHDCDFKLDNALRKVVIAGLPNDTVKLSDPDVIKQCLSVQINFEKFQSEVCTLPVKKNRNGLVIDYATEIEGKSVCIRTYNTAWVSQLHEDPGKMSFPRALMSDDDETWNGSDVTVSALHHPPHWLLPSRKRLMTQHLEATSDLVLYGHEHLGEEYVKSDFWGDITGVVYGGCFQNPPHDCPGECNVIVIDPHLSRFKFTAYRRQGEIFKEVRRNDNWLPLLRDSKLLGGRFDLREQKLHWLSETDADYAHPTGKRLSHDDIFIVPDFTKISDDGSRRQKSDLLNGELFEHELLSNKRLLIYGDERSGKSALAKYSLLRIGKTGVTPIYIDASLIGIKELRDIELITKTAFAEMYEDTLLERFDQLSPCKKAVVIDDLHKSQLSAEGRKHLLSTLCTKFEFVIAFGDSSMFIEEISDLAFLDSTLDGFSRLRIRELGRYARRRLIRQWYSIGREFGQPNDDMSHRIARAEEVITTLLGKSFIPAHPVIILGFLSTLDQAKPLDHVGSYGYHYEMAITNALTRKQGRVKSDIKFRFLAELAYYLFKNNRRNASETDIKLVYRKYSDEYGIDPGLPILKGELLECGILSFYDEEYHFKYDYALYFFIARYFREHLDNPAIKIQIKEICSKMSVDLNANVLLFLAHQSKDQFILDCMLTVADSIFVSANVSALDDELKFVGEMFSSLPKIVVPISSIEDNIKESYERKDKADDKIEEKWERNEDDDFVKALDSMIRSVVVLGQILKNFPGSLTLDQKAALIRGAFGAGLRVLSEILKKINEGKEELTKHVANRISEKSPSADIEEIRERTSASLFWLIEANIFGIIRLLSVGVGAPGEDVAFGRVLGELNSNAGRLLKVAIGLDTLRMPKSDILDCKDRFRSNLMCLHILRGLVAHHFYLFPVKESVRSEICDKLNIELGDKERQERALGYRAKRI